MTNQEKLDFALAKIKAIKGNVAAKRDRIKYYTESLKDSAKWDQITFEKLESFDFEKEVINRQKAIDLQKKCRSKVKPYSLQEFEQDLNQIKNLSKTI
jgi:dGTP triphosphohydrolase